MKCALIVTAAGTSSRFGSPKLLHTIEGKTVLRLSLESFISQSFDYIAVTSSIEMMTEYKRIIDSVSLSAPIHLLEGASTRFESVKKALSSLPKDIESVWIHDAARPFLSQALIQRLSDASFQHDSVIPGLPETDTVKLVTKNRVEKTLDRSRVYRIQTPQVFKKHVVDRLLKHTFKNPEVVTDESLAVEVLGLSIFVVDGDEKNRKITFLEDG
jgi:2-C-methyl-D-erythritol 4-phosphate cytidylyltransferase